MHWSTKYTNEIKANIFNENKQWYPTPDWPIITDAPNNRNKTHFHVDNLSNTMNLLQVSALITRCWNYIAKEQAFIL